jgi:hypothetical protein
VEKKMILVNTDYISGKNLEMLGLVKGSTIQSKNIGKDITQSFKTLVGGELKAYNEMMNEARALATKRMVEEAESLGCKYPLCIFCSYAGGSRSHCIWYGCKIYKLAKSS